MGIKHFVIAFVALIFTGCLPQADLIVINGKIEGGAGKYIKYINMAHPGFKADSLLLDMGGNFTFEKETSQPQDLIFYFKNTNAIRITPQVNETILLQAKAANLIESYTIDGSEESKLVQPIIRRTYYSAQIIDTLNAFYMKNQMHPKLDSIVDRLVFISDSIFENDKQYFENFIKRNPGSLASYIALSQKLDTEKPYFSIHNDLTYFEMVDTALRSRYDTIPMSKMLKMYVMHAKKNKHNRNKNKKTRLIPGMTAPEIYLPNVYGDSLKLSDLRGKYVLVDFWGSWCRPCRTENKNLRTAYRKYRYRGFEIYQVAIERSKTDWKNTIREDRLYWRNQVSELNYMESKAAKDYGVTKIPSNFLIDPEGKIIAINLYAESLLNKLEELFTPKPVMQDQNQD